MHCCPSRDRICKQCTDQVEVEEVILGVEVEASEVAEMVEDEAEVEEIANSRYVNIIFNIVRICIQ